MTATLAHFGISDYRRQSTRISAATADATRRGAAAAPAGRAVLIVDSIDVTAAGVPILTTRARFAADRVELVVAS